MLKEEKKLPIRKCTGCGERFDKSSLVRIVKIPSGEIVLDKTGKLSGRGAYICKSAQCLKKAEKASRLDRSLSASVPKEVYERLAEELQK